jgi:hypothetical protein
MQNCNVLLIPGQIALVDMPTVTDFKDFEAFKACRAFARDIGLLVRNTEICAEPEASRSNGKGVNFNPIEFCGGI